MLSELLSDMNWRISFIEFKKYLIRRWWFFNSKDENSSLKANSIKPIALRLLSLIAPMSFFSVGILAPADANANALVLSNLSNSYSNCYFKNNGNGTSVASVTINYKSASGHTAGAAFVSRAVLVYSYDKNGKLQQNKSLVGGVVMNNINGLFQFIDNDYSAYYHGGNTPWGKGDSFSANVVVYFYNNVLGDWPAVAVRAGNYTYSTVVGEINGVVYLSAKDSNSGSCKILTNPETPPPFDINISVSAPDWNLGDLQSGQSDTSLSAADQQLCFSYAATDVQKQKFIISASNANGVINNRYLLRHLSDAAQTVPYSLTLDSGSTQLQLPNNSTELSLDGTGRTCFVPTFHTEVGKTTEEGDYSDVLNFTVTTKP